MKRPLVAAVDYRAIRSNLSRARALAPGSRVVAVVKAHAYGHGIGRTVQALADADAFGVCCLEEAAQVRSAAPQARVLLMEGCFSVAEYTEAVAMGLESVVHNQDQLAMLASIRPQSFRVWLKIDTGMRRLGLAPREVSAAWESLGASVPGTHHLMTHLAAVEDAAFTRRQLSCFAQATAGIAAERSIANSAALLTLPATHADWVRPGVMLYGASPLSGTCGADHGLQLAMRLQSRLIAVHDLSRGDRVGYGAAWECPADMRVGIVAAGYADGYPRHAASGTPVLVGGRRARLIAPASMDMLAVALPRDGADFTVGDPVLLWGPELPVEQVAAGAHTIAHHLLSGIGRRVPVEEYGAD